MFYPQFKGVVVAVPHTGRCVPPQFAYSLLNAHPPMNYNTYFAQTWNKPVDEARNFFARHSMECKAKYLFTIDEDVSFPGHALRQMIFTLEHHPEIGVVGGVVCHKEEPHAPMIFRAMGDGPYWDWKAGELFECWGIGMGCTLTRVDVFRNVEGPWFKTVNDNHWMLDQVNKAEQWTEDLYFCEKATKAGWKVYADGGILCDHHYMEPQYSMRLNQGLSVEPARLAPDSKPLMHLAVPKGTKKIVDLGSGEAPYQTNEGEVITVDIREEVHPDYRSDLRQLPFDNGAFDIVFSSHVLEHFSREEVPQVLKEWTRLVSKDGEIRLVLPNVEWAAEQIKAGVMNEHVLNVLYGAQTYEQNFHKFCFTPKVLEGLLKGEGFTYQQVALEGYNLMVRAWRKKPKEVKNAQWPAGLEPKKNGRPKRKKR